MKKIFFISLFIIFIIFSQNIFSENINISGNTKNNEEFIPNVSIFFIDKNDNIFETKSDNLGKFSISVPKNNYFINIEKDFFRISEENLKSYNFKNNDFLDIKLESSSSFFDGFVVDKNENPIPNAKIIIKSNNFSSNIFSDNSGKFSTYLKPGIFTFIISKYGYSSTGFIREIKKKSSINNEKVILNSFNFFLKGTVTDGIKSLKNIEVSLHNKFLKKIDSTTTDKDGIFYFYKIPLEENFFLLINNKNYKKYKSKPLKFNKKIKNKIIFLEKL
ncbi:MAG: hypothetical protein CR959_02435 [Fusobacteriales bacterium]|nr:MAG: hypothetical protein CR959_02435 [Fusobacteriales bacterium]